MPRPSQTTVRALVLALPVLGMLIAQGCTKRNAVTCADDGDCRSQDGIAGACVRNPGSGSLWCAYPDRTCESGLRWGASAGDELFETCAGTSAVGIDACSPDTCETLAVECGLVANGCGALIDCGVCALPETCGGDGVANQCGCVPVTCEGVGASCGHAPDGCGGVLDCGECTLPETCGADGVPNQCSCVPATSCDEVGAECGETSDGCFGTLDCGGCMIVNATCVGSRCRCGPLLTVCETPEGTVCADLKSDAYCGACDNACDPFSACVGGICVPL